MDLKHMADFLLLTGAGYTKNWGGWLASELWAEILSHPLVQQNQGLKNIVWEYKDKGFEAIFDDKRISQNPEYFNNFQAVIKDSFARMHQIIPDNLGEFNRVVSNFVYEFDAYFTLNQDIFFEALHPPLSDSSLRYFYPHLRSRDYFQYNRPQHLRNVESSNFNNLFGSLAFDATLTPDSKPYDQTHNPLAAISVGSQIRKPLPYYKLHGSLNFIATTGSNWDELQWDRKEWGDSKDVLVMGGSKPKQIKNFPLLARYHEDFENALKKAKRLMIIGYSFADAHINQKIFDAVENHGLKFWIIDVAPLSKLIINAAIAAQPQEMLKDEVKRYTRPLRPGGRGYTENEIFEEVLVPKYEGKFKKGLISISNNSLREIFSSGREIDRISERFFN